MTIADINSLDRGRFIESLGWIFEHSPWVVERAWTRRPFADLDALHAAMVAEVEAATPEEHQLYADADAGRPKTVDEFLLTRAARAKSGR